MMSRKKGFIILKVGTGRIEEGFSIPRILLKFCNSTDE
jgi:hypothetical protein